MLLFAIAGAQLVDLGASRRGRSGRGSACGRCRGRRCSLPHLTFAAGAVIFQLLLPSTLVPDNGNSRRFIATRLWSLDNGNRPRRHRPQYPAHLVSQLGLHEPPVFGRWMIGLAALGAVVACVKAPRRNVPLAVLVPDDDAGDRHPPAHGRPLLHADHPAHRLLRGDAAALRRRLARPPASPAARCASPAAAPSPSSPPPRSSGSPCIHATDLPRRVDAAQALQRLRRRAARPGAGAEPGRHGGDREVHPARRHRRLLPGPHGDAVHRPAGPADHVAQQHGGRRRLVHAEQEGQLLAGRGHARAARPPSGFELVWEDDDWRLWRIPDGPVELAASSPMFNRCSTTTTVVGSPP